MAKELEALEQNHTCTLDSLPSSKKAIDSKWVYKIKYNSDGSIERYKSCLVAKGYTQVEGLDYTESFTPVAKLTTVITLLAIAAAKLWGLHQLDVHNAFLHGDLDEEVYMTPPLDTWQPLTTANNSAHASTLKNYLDNCFHIKDLGPVNYFLGLEVARSPDGIFLSQRKYTLDILQETGMTGTKPISFPMEQNHKLALDDSVPLDNLGAYRRLIGRLIYLTITHPELCYSVHILSQVMHQPHHWH
ncbi:UNVERIFIED_CONTAM: Retrovirus-related Pol polyprotein from transposon RE2 [Sesamum radiatum]|uniref:Retrovirus-related Pol polyprotein from transposon RE2 n=1 Tax=Sesamum radiatum TaxID=300843 RepID=A0AAW2TIJ2_SESRA